MSVAPPLTRANGWAGTFARSCGRLVNRALAPAGLRLARLYESRAPRAQQIPLDLRGTVSDPLEATYHARGRSFVIDVPLQICRAFEETPFACTADAGHPFIETLLAYRRGVCHAYRDSPLRWFYESWQPANAAEALDLDPGQSHTALKTAPVVGVVMPWDARSPRTCATLWAEWVKIEHLKHGVDIPPRPWLSWSVMGELDFTRLTRVYESIRRKGYLRSDKPDGDIGGYILRSDGESRILIFGAGNHRIAALAALGCEQVPIRLLPFILHRDDVVSWPNVRSGLFTEEQALAVFDRVFEGCLPKNFSLATMLKSGRC